MFDRGFELVAGVDEEHHAVVGEGGNGEDHEEGGEPAGAHEGVREAEDAGADDGDEDVGEGLGGGGERRVMGGGEERGVFGWEGAEGVGGGGCLFVENHDCAFRVVVMRNSAARTPTVPF